MRVRVPLAPQTPVAAPLGGVRRALQLATWSPYVLWQSRVDKMTSSIMQHRPALSCYRNHAHVCLRLPPNPHVGERCHQSQSGAPYSACSDSTLVGTVLKRLQLMWSTQGASR